MNFIPWFFVIRLYIMAVAASAILYFMSKDNLNSLDVNVSVEKSKHPFHSFIVGLPMIALTETSFPKPNDKRIGRLSTEV